MSKVINLSKARKARTRADSRAQADANAVRFGRTKAERQIEDAQIAKAKRNLDQHERE
ncbi:protein of unknown function [Monaibacterium marinum]|uniref:DUF4169 domain-containing protein n=1 Tax=Pontivivens marinum TaxID=1690039 RepID=A0A2C9CV28_9RHOB|nr:DUF4169 family protein [Monaibacterium marinum]SOH95122.1 protein of unknown function [Monaibacterium marinum]